MLAKFKFWILSIILLFSLCEVLAETTSGNDDELCKNPKIKNILESYHEDIILSLYNGKLIFNGVIKDIKVLNGSNEKVNMKAKELTDLSTILEMPRYYPGYYSADDHENYCEEVKLFDQFINILNGFENSMKSPSAEDLIFNLLLERNILQRLDSEFIEKFTSYWARFDRAADNLASLLSAQEKAELENIKNWFSNLAMVKKLAAYKYFSNTCQKKN